MLAAAMIRSHRRLLRVWLSIGFEASLAGVAWALGGVFGQPPLESFRWSALDAAVGVAATGPMLLAFLVVMYSPWRGLGRIRRFVDEVLRPLFRTYWLIELGILAACAGVSEEMLFRGVLQPLLGRWLLPWPGLILASVMFGLLHPISGAYVVLATLFGIYLGGLVLATSNLLDAMIAHGLYDFIVLVFLVRSGREATEEVQ
jgi:membrane protease YdiL (CAAX protease family)